MFVFNCYKSYTLQTLKINRINNIHFLYYIFKNSEVACYTFYFILKESLSTNNT